ncbi:MAG: DUF262 domain-containing protein, partial [Acidimicrobiia bacterium]|nr:DUF262 domain-containing protein [Acidimicrobiia bacterium]
MRIAIESTIKPSSKILFDENLIKLGSIESYISSISIPLFQRTYDWDEEKLYRLLLDVHSFLNSEYSDGENYFAGTILLERPSSDNSYKYELIDGQQRMTSLYLMAFVTYLLSKLRLLNIDIQKYTPGRQVLEYNLRSQKFKSFEKKLFSRINEEILDNEIFGQDFVDYEGEDREKKIKTRIAELSKKERKIYWENVEPKLVFESNDIQDEFKRVLENSNLSLVNNQLEYSSELKSSNYYKRLNDIVNYVNQQFFSDDINTEES